MLEGSSYMFYVIRINNFRNFMLDLHKELLLKSGLHFIPFNIIGYRMPIQTIKLKRKLNINSYDINVYGDKDEL